MVCSAKVSDPLMTDFHISKHI